MQSRSLKILRKMTFENIVGKGENTGNLPAFFPFPTMFSTLSGTEIIISAAFNLPSANALNLVQSKKLSFGKELMALYEGLLTIQLWRALNKIGLHLCTTSVILLYTLGKVNGCEQQNKGGNHQENMVEKCTGVYPFIIIFMTSGQV